MAKAVLQAEFRREGATVEEAAAKAEEAMEQMATRLVFGRVPAQRKARHRRAKPEVKVVSFGSLLEANDGEGLSPADEPVQLAMFAL